MWEFEQCRRALITIVGERESERERAWRAYGERKKVRAIERGLDDKKKWRNWNWTNVIFDDERDEWNAVTVVERRKWDWVKFVVFLFCLYIRVVSLAQFTQWIRLRLRNILMSFKLIFTLIIEWSTLYLYTINNNKSWKLVEHLRLAAWNLFCAWLIN